MGEDDVYVIDLQSLETGFDTLDDVFCMPKIRYSLSAGFLQPTDCDSSPSGWDLCDQFQRRPLGRKI